MVCRAAASFKPIFNTNRCAFIGDESIFRSVQNWTLHRPLIIMRLQATTPIPTLELCQRFDGGASCNNRLPEFVIIA